MTAMSSRRKKRKLKAEINVVPYIDVMLVLLIIFMVTAPLLNLGVDIELPQSNARPLEQKKDPVVVSLDRDGNLWIVLQGRSFRGRRGGHGPAEYSAGAVCYNVGLLRS